MGEISLQDISVSYKNQQVLKRISGNFKPGSMVAVVGPNGGGKSTLLKALTSLVPLADGKINYHHLTSHDIAYLPQHAEIDCSFPLTIKDVVAFGLCQKYGFYRALPKDCSSQVMKALETVNLDTCLNRSLYMLSGGQFQRVLFARLAIQDAQILLLDEPFSAVDTHTTEDLMKILAKWNHQGKTIIMVTHDLDLVHEYFPQTILLARENLGWGTTGDILAHDNLLRAKKLSKCWEKCIRPNGECALSMLN